jgi:hypothetical protein
MRRQLGAFASSPAIAQPDKTAGGGCRDAAREHLLAHRRSLPQHAYSGRHVHAQHNPDTPELRRPQRLVDVNVLVVTSFLG